MALFKIFKGNSNKLGAAPGAGEQDTRKTHDGFAYFTPNDGKFYIDIADSNTAQIGVNRIPLSADKADRLTTLDSANRLTYTTTDNSGNIILETLPNSYADGHIISIGNDQNDDFFSRINMGDCTSDSYGPLGCINLTEFNDDELTISAKQKLIFQGGKFVKFYTDYDPEEITKQYYLGDIVKYEDNYYICKKINTNCIPNDFNSKYWSLIPTQNSILFIPADTNHAVNIAGSLSQGMGSIGTNISFAQGGNTQATGEFSHAEGVGDYWHNTDTVFWKQGNQEHRGLYLRYVSINPQNSNLNLYDVYTKSINTKTNAFTYVQDVTIKNKLTKDHVITKTDNIQEYRVREYISSTRISLDKSFGNSYNYVPILYKLGYQGAKGWWSHSEGQTCLARAMGSHAEGYRTKAFGQYSHAEGRMTHANDDGSHTEGYRTWTRGRYSHAEGYYTFANGRGAHAQGKYTMAAGDFSFSTGGVIGNKAMKEFVDKKRPIIILSGTKDNSNYYSFSSPDSSSIKKYDCVHFKNKYYIVEDIDYLNNKIKLYKFERTNDDRSGAHYCTDDFSNKDQAAFLNGISVAGLSFSEGKGTVTYGSYSHAEGMLTRTGLAINNKIQTGAAAHAEGYRTIAEGDFSHSEGKLTKAFCKSSHAEGEGTIANEVGAHAEGSSLVYVIRHPTYENDKFYWDTDYFSDTEITLEIGDMVATRDNSIAIITEVNHNEHWFTTDNNSKVLNNKRGILLLRGRAEGRYSHSEGIGNRAFGRGSHAEGYNTIAGDFTLDEDNNKIFYGNYAHSEGMHTKASGLASHTEGYNTIADDDYAHAEGYKTYASSCCAHAEGYYTEALNDFEHAQGKYNVSNLNTISSIGIGTDDDHRKNAVEVMRNGDVYIIGIGSYDGTTVSGVSSLQSIINSSVTGVKGNDELSYRTGQVNITPANILGTSTAAKFWRGDNTWSDTISGGTLKITNNGNTVTIGSQNQNWCHIYNSANIPFVFNKTVATSSGNLGTSTYRWGKLYVGTADSYGSATQPVYWDAGVPKAIDYTIQTSVPAGAVFTDTKNTAGSTQTSGDLFLIGATSQAANPQTYSSSQLKYINSTNTLYTQNEELTGTLIVTGQTTLNDNLSAQGITATDLLVTGNTSFTQIPTAPTAADNDNSTQLATTQFVYNAFRTNDAMVFKGVINANSDLPATHYQGWTYKIGTAGTYAGQTCEIGDTIYCITDGTSANNDHWVVVQNNIDILPVARGGTGATTAAAARTNLGLGSFATKSSLAWNEIAQSGANSIQEGTGDLTDNTEIFTSYASNNGFADTNALGQVYRRDAIKVYNYIKNKLAVTNDNISLDWNTETTIATIGGTAIKVKIPANPDTNTDTKVKQSSTTTSDWRKILLHYNHEGTASANITTATEQVYASAGVSVQPSTNTIRAMAYNVSDNSTIQYNTSNGCLEIIV